MIFGVFMIVGSSFLIALFCFVLFSLIGSYKKWSLIHLVGVFTKGTTFAFLLLVFSLKGLILAMGVYHDFSILTMLSIVQIFIDMAVLIFIMVSLDSYKRVKSLFKIYEKVFLPVFNDKDEIVYIKLKTIFNQWGNNRTDDYGEIQSLIRYYTKKQKLSNFEYVTFIANVYFGYSNDSLFSIKSKLPEDSVGWFEESSYPNERPKGLRFQSWASFFYVNNNSNEQEVIATKYLTAFQTVQNLIGLKLESKVKEKVLRLFDTFANELAEGVAEIRETEEKLKQEERMVYKKQQERLNDLMDVVLNLYEKS